MGSILRHDVRRSSPPITPHRALNSDDCRRDLRWHSSGSRLGRPCRAGEPVKRRRTALRQQIADEAAATATALEAEAKLDAAQVAALQAQRDAETATATTSRV